MEPSVSVIIPVYNVKPYLERCLDSVLHQTFQNFELILVDDGSEDGSSELCDSYAGRWEKIRVIHQPNMGAGLSRNHGLEAARGRYIMFSDSDDYMECNLLKSLYEAVTRADADCAVAGCTVEYSDKRTSAFSYVKQEEHFRTREDMDRLLLGSVSSPPGHGLDSVYGQSACARMYRRELFAEHNIRFVSERECISEDIVFNVDFLKHAGRAVAIPDTSYHYECGHRGSLSKGYRSTWLEKELHLYDVLEKRFAEIFTRNQYIHYLQRFLIIRIAFDITQEIRYHDHVDRNHPMRKAVKQMLANEKLQEALREYPWRKLPFLRRILAGTMRFQLTELLIFLIRIQQRIMKSSQNI